MSELFFDKLKNEIKESLVDSTLSLYKIPRKYNFLNNHLRNSLMNDECLLKGPYFESMFSWESSSVTIKDLASKENNYLLSEKVVDVLTTECTEKFQMKFPLYKHQLEVIKHLLDKKQANSAVITSGTGSGKTECFMVPIIQDIYQHLDKKSDNDVGVQAIFLYPLNALINSQRERLDSWTKPFDGKIKFAMYNGHTPHTLSKVDGLASSKNEIMDRANLRKTPPQILVTNGTMLEYMIVRKEDNPILENSKGKLRWIVLDEAHTYIGSNAAELAMQLRRVMSAFDVDFDKVHIVATSATISSNNAEAELKQFLSDLSGVSKDRIKVFGGKRTIPQIPKNINSLEVLGFNELNNKIENINSTGKQGHDDQVYELLCKNRIACTIVSKIVSSGEQYKSIDSIIEAIQKTCNITLTESEFLQWIDLCSSVKHSTKDFFLKIRAHFFQRTINGLWSCVNSNCKCKQGTMLDNKDWSFGNVYTQYKEKCECGFPTYELGFCNECLEPHLMFYYDRFEKQGEMVEKAYSKSTFINDEFSLLDDDKDDYSEEVDDDTNEQINTQNKGSKLDVGYFVPHMDNDFGTVDECSINTDGFMDSNDSNEKVDVLFNITEEGSITCSNCQKTFSIQPFLRKFNSGGSFYTRIVTPIILKYCKPYSASTDIPNNGRRLITFTDSRQSTAIMTLLMQQEAEKASLRNAVIKSIVKKTINNQELNANCQTLETLKGLYKKYNDPELLIQIENEEAKIAEFSSRVSWREAKGDIINHPNFQFIIKQNQKKYNIASDDDVIEIMLLREFLRKPSKANNLETLGLVTLKYNKLDEIVNCPDIWASCGLTIEDWRKYLKLYLDDVIRERYAVEVKKDLPRLLGFTFHTKYFVDREEFNKTKKEVSESIRTQEGEDDTYAIKSKVIFPTTYKANGGIKSKFSRFISYTALLLGIKDYKDNVFNTKLENILESAKQALLDQKLLEPSSNKSGYIINTESFYFSLVKKGYMCPYTNRIIDVAIKGYSPYFPTYLLKNCNFDRIVKCTELNMPNFISLLDHNSLHQTEDIKKSIRENKEIESLKYDGLWTDLHNQVLVGDGFYTVAEHSAQITKSELSYFETKFKKGELNVLNCSTTMEMGVDIGGISSVIMNNLPPHSSNYFQRAGRAGRSGESRAFSYTLCKNSPHNLRGFNDPNTLFKEEISCPDIKLNTQRIIERHVNAFLLSTFLAKFDFKSNIFSNCFSFFMNGNIDDVDQLFTQVNTTDELGNEAKIFKVKEEFTKDSVSSKFEEWLSSGIDKNDRKKLERITQNTALHGISVKTYITEKVLPIVKDFREKWYKELAYLYFHINEAEEKSNYWYKFSTAIKRLKQKPYLQYLGGIGFLPNYNSPAGVKELCTNNLTENKKDKSEKASEYTYNDYPSRPFAQAIQEYAPGNKVVVNGNVYTVAGINVGSKYSARDKCVRDSIFYCKTCGYFDVVNDYLPSCPKCDSAAIENKSFITPASFTVDFWNSPTNNATDIVYSKRSAPMLKVEGKKQILQSGLGYFKNSTNSSIFFYNKGRYDKGYCVCLSCGAIADQTNDEFPKLFTNYTRPGEHNMLGKKKGKNADEHKVSICPNINVIKNVWLGGKELTDAFELELLDKNSHGIKDKSIAFTLGVALKLALCDILGISSKEINVLVKNVNNSMGGQHYLIQLYDTASGGAGFSSQAADNIDTLLINAIKLINSDCCIDGCAKCLLDFDSISSVEDIAKGKTKSWIESNDILAKIDLPEKLVKLFNNEKKSNIRFEHRSMNNILDNIYKLNPTRIEFFASSTPNLWDTSIEDISSNILSLCSRIDKDCKICFVIPSRTNYDYNDEERSFIHRLSTIVGNDQIEIRALNKSTNPNVFMQIHYNEKQENNNEIEKIDSFASEEPNIRNFAENWPFVEFSEPTVISSTVKRNYSDVFDMTNIENKDENIVYDKISGEFNVAVSNFGKKLFSYLAKKSPALKEKLGTKYKVTQMEYSDRYMLSPSHQTVFLLLLKYICEDAFDTSNCDFTLKISKYSEGKNFDSFYSNWVDRDQMKKVLSSILNDLPLYSSNVLVDEGSTMNHERYLNIVFADGSSFKVKFDKGLCYWNVYKFGNNPKVFMDFKSNDLCYKKITEILSTINNNYTIQNEANDTTSISFIFNSKDIGK